MCVVLCGSGYGAYLAATLYAGGGCAAGAAGAGVGQDVGCLQGVYGQLCQLGVLGEEEPGVDTVEGGLAEALRISPKTMGCLLHRARVVLRARTLAHAVALGGESGLLERPRG